MSSSGSGPQSPRIPDLLSILILKLATMELVSGVSQDATSRVIITTMGLKQPMSFSGDGLQPCMHRHMDRLWFAGSIGNAIRLESQRCRRNGPDDLLKISSTCAPSWNKQPTVTLTGRVQVKIMWK